MACPAVTGAQVVKYGDAFHKVGPLPVELFLAPHDIHFRNPVVPPPCRKLRRINKREHVHVGTVENRMRKYSRVPLVAFYAHHAKIWWVVRLCALAGVYKK